MGVRIYSCFVSALAVLLQMSILTDMLCARVLSHPVKCFVRPILSSQMFGAIVLSPPVKCFARGSYPLQSNVLCEGPIPSSLIGHWPIGFGSLCSCHTFDPISTHWFSPFTLGAFRHCNSVEMGSFFLPDKLGAKPRNGLRTGHP